jgi:hypothetical protein
MWEFPFLSLRSHRETLAAKDETIAIQQETIANLTASLHAFDSLIESLKPKPQVPVPARERERTPRAPAIDYAALDPDNNEQLVSAALAEMGPGKHNVVRLQQRVQHIRRTIIAAQKERERRALEPGPPIPAAIEQLIEETLAQGESAGAEMVA